MNFQTKLNIITLAILVGSLLLTSVLSLASFEQVYTDSLISTFEIAGRNLKRKIEPSLALGKPLNKFSGMDRLLTEVTTATPQLTVLAITDLEGRILYHLDPERQGEQLPYPVPNITDPDDAHGESVGGTYIGFIPLFLRDKPVGLIHLAFDYQVVYDRLRPLAMENLKSLGVIMLIACVLLTLLINALIAKPLRGRFHAMAMAMDDSREEPFRLSMQQDHPPLLPRLETHVDDCLEQIETARAQLIGVGNQEQTLARLVAETVSIPSTEMSLDSECRQSLVRLGELLAPPTGIPPLEDPTALRAQLANLEQRIEHHGRETISPGELRALLVARATIEQIIYYRSTRESLDRSVTVAESPES